MTPAVSTYGPIEKVMTNAWSEFAVACIAIFMMSLDTTILYAGFNIIPF